MFRLSFFQFFQLTPAEKMAKKAEDAVKLQEIKRKARLEYIKGCEVHEIYPKVLRKIKEAAKNGKREVNWDTHGTYKFCEPECYHLCLAQSLIPKLRKDGFDVSKDPYKPSNDRYSPYYGFQISW